MCAQFRAWLRMASKPPDGNFHVTLASSQKADTPVRYGRIWCHYISPSSTLETASINDDAQPGQPLFPRSKLATHTNARDAL
jgi:hypothetical protein